MRRKRLRRAVKESLHDFAHSVEPRLLDAQSRFVTVGSAHFRRVTIPFCARRSMIVRTVVYARGRDNANR